MFSWKRIPSRGAGAIFGETLRGPTAPPSRLQSSCPTQKRPLFLVFPPALSLYYVTKVSFLPWPLAASHPSRSTRQSLCPLPVGLHLVALRSSSSALLRPVSHLWPRPSGPPSGDAPPPAQPRPAAALPVPSPGLASQATLNPRLRPILAPSVTSVPPPHGDLLPTLALSCPPLTQHDPARPSQSLEPRPLWHHPLSLDPSPSLAQTVTWPRSGPALTSRSVGVQVGAPTLKAPAARGGEGIPQAGQDRVVWKGADCWKGAQRPNQDPTSLRVGRRGAGWRFRQNLQCNPGTWGLGLTPPPRLGRCIQNTYKRSPS